MKIDDSKKRPTCGHRLSSFDTGDCIRLVHNDDHLTLFVDDVYLVGSSEGQRPLAINLSSGMHRDSGLFMLEPNARVVIE